MKAEESGEARTLANARFRDEIARFDLRFRCESCAHVARTSASCSLGYPDHFLRGELRAIEPSGALTFCKCFELGETDEG